MQDELRELAPSGVRTCGLGLVYGKGGSQPSFVDVMVRQTERGGRAHFHGTERCACWHSCAKCSDVLRSKRGVEVTTAAEYWSGTGGWLGMGTFTFGHYVSDDPKQLNRDMLKCWRGLTRGNPWKRQKAELGLVHYVRGQDHTWGPNGLHPHLHVVMMFARKPSRLAIDKLRARWDAMVIKHMGREHRPTWQRGCVIKQCRRREYIVKLGLELVSSQTKRARRKEGETPWQLARRAAAGDHDAIERWTLYGKAMRGQKQLSWSKALRAAAGIGVEQSDQAIVDAEGNDAEEIHVASLSLSLWAHVKGKRGARARILSAAEKSGRMGVANVLALYLYGLAPPDDGEMTDQLTLDLFDSIAPTTALDIAQRAT